MTDNETGYQAQLRQRTQEARQKTAEVNAMIKQEKANNVHRLFGVTADITGLDETREYENAETDAAYQSWVRRHIAMIENLQAERIRLIEQKKAEMDAVIARKQAEIDNLKASLTIGGVE